MKQGRRQARSVDGQAVLRLDGAGNREEQVVNLAKDEETAAEKTYFPVNCANELECRQTVSGKCTTGDELSAYTYDGAGEELSITPKSDTSGATFAYNAAGETSSVTPWMWLPPSSDHDDCSRQACFRSVQSGKRHPCQNLQPSATAQCYRKVSVSLALVPALLYSVSTVPRVALYLPVPPVIVRRLVSLALDIVPAN
jgi:hypothetical protein